MSTSFSKLKEQLSELSETINQFDSEAVQLRIVELLFNQHGSPMAGMEEPGAGYSAGPEFQQHSNTASKKHISHKSTRGRKRSTEVQTGSSASGAVAALANLVESDFFEQQRTIGDVVYQCEVAYGMHYKSNAFSGPLSRLASSGVLKREKNAEGKFAYFK